MCVQYVYLTKLIWAKRVFGESQVRGIYNICIAEPSSLGVLGTGLAYLPIYSPGIHRPHQNTALGSFLCFQLFMGARRLPWNIAGAFWIRLQF